jgi:PAS domain S-box-containing protein
MTKSDAARSEVPRSKRTDAVFDLPILVAAMENAAPMTITDDAGTIRWVNRAFCDATGYAAPELVGRNIRILNSGRHSKTLFAEMWRTILEGLTWKGKLINRRKNGGEYTASVHISPVRGRTGQITHLLAIQQAADPCGAVSAPRVPDAEITTAAGRFACGIAPDLSRLLGEINSNTVSMLRARQLQPETSERSERILRAGEQAAGLAGWLMAFSRRQTREFLPVQLNRLVLALREHLQAILPPNIELRFALDPGLGELRADEPAIQEALIHLVVNARDAMRDGGTLTIETATVWQRREGAAKPQGYVLLRVTDTGVGMDQATESRIFEPFYTTKQNAPAAGLGLSAVYGIVKQAGGWISVYTEPGAGSSVEVFLPRQTEV